MSLDFIRLDREVARAVPAWRAAMRELTRHGPAGAAALDGPAMPRLENPLDPWRRVSSRTTYLELMGRRPSIGAELGLSATEPPAPDPTGLAEPLAAWVHALTLERVLFVDRVRLAAAWHAATVITSTEAQERGFGADGSGRRTEAPSVGSELMSPRATLLRLLAEPSDAGRRVFADALTRGAGQVADAARILVERRHEATQRLGVDAACALEIPIDPPEAALAAAEAILHRTEPLLARASTWDGAIARAVGREAGGGWPARLGHYWIEDLFRKTGLTQGLSLDLGPLPRPIGASSFARALGSFGAALAQASGGAPFSLAHPPFDLRCARRAGLFGGLVADPTFCARALGLGKARALDQARHAAHALMNSLRLEAARVALVFDARGSGSPSGALRPKGTTPRMPDGGHVLLLSPRDRNDRFEETTARALGAPIPGALAGAVPALDEGSAVRLAGALLAARDRRGLIERFDEDWFRNPRAAEAIRGEDASPTPPRVTAAELDEGLDAMTQALAAL